MDISKVLESKEENYGSFVKHAALSQRLKEIVFESVGSLEPYQIEALEMICVKLARIAGGNPDYIDSWLDLAGYAQLVANELDKN